MANDDFKDLTEPEGSEEASNGKKKKEKTPKPPKEPKQPKEKLTKAEKKAAKKAGKGKKKRGKLKIILIIVLVLLVAGFVFEEIYYNYLGTRDMLIDAVVKLDPAYGTREKKLNERESLLDAREADLDAREKTVTSRENQNDRRTASLDTREKDVNDLLQWSLPLYRRQMTEQELTDMQSVSMSYSRMAPEIAAAILMELNDPDDVAAILYYMSERSAAAILAVMDPEFAAVITEIFLYK